MENHGYVQLSGEASPRFLRRLKRWQNNPEPLPVVMTERSHLFPYRTQKLSSPVPKVLGWTRPGRIGRCRFPLKESQSRLFSFTCGHSRERSAQPDRNMVQRNAACRFPLKSLNRGPFFFCMRDQVRFDKNRGSTKAGLTFQDMSCIIIRYTL